MANPVVHFEIGAADEQPLVKFYGELFGWGLRAVPGVGYTLVDTRGGGGINGGIGRSQTGETWATFYVEVDDPQAFLDRAGELGGRTVAPVTELPGMATYAMFDDPDGLVVGLVQGEGAQDEATRAALGPSEGSGAAVDWFEVLGADAGRSQAFYAELFGWSVPGGGYGQVDAGADHGIRGGIGAGGEARWATVYASVGDVEATLARAEALGATRVYGPSQVDGHTETGAFRDPAGNVFGVYHRATP
jgi:predicted enzyme related to lactoylglutathione lyase